MKIDLVELPSGGGENDADGFLAVVKQMVRQMQGIPAILEDPGFRCARVRRGQNQPTAWSGPCLKFLQCEHGIMEMLQHHPADDEIEGFRRRRCGLEVSRMYWIAQSARCRG